MFSRIRTALGLTLLLTLITSITVFAKGSFAFITITGPDLIESTRSTDPALTTDFFAFAEFYQNQTEAPADPGMGYEITRYYVNGGRETAFDRLHYYPETGYVYFDGLVNGSSEYDGKWYPAKPEVKDVFLKALISPSIVKTESQSSAPQPQVVDPTTLADPVSPIDTQPIALFSAIVVLAVVVALVTWRRRTLAH